LLFLFPVVHSGQIPEFIQTDTSIRERIRKDIYVLASDSLQGRRSGSEGEFKAARYIIECFRNAGLQPKGDGDSSFIQSFPQDHFIYNYTENKLRIENQKFNYYFDFGATRFSGNDSATGEVLDAGYGIVSGKYDLDDYRFLDDPAEKIVLINIGLPHQIRKKDTAEETIKPSARILTAFSRGARAVILWNRDSPYFNKDLFDFSIHDTVGKPVIFANTKVIKYLENHYRGKTSIRVRKQWSREDYHNVVGYVDNHALKTVVFGAHYDHMGISKNKEIRYGADDNASGVALVMELARYLSTAGAHTSNYLFIAFSGEEEGLLGSTYFCAHPVIDLSQVSFMFNFDMVGRLGCEGNKIYAFATSTSPQWNSLYDKMPSFGFRVKKIHGSGAFSDSYPFYTKQIPEVYLTTGFHYDYHTPCDKADRINYDGMVSMVKYTESFLTLAENLGSISFSKVPGFYQFTGYWKYVVEELDYVLTVGMAGAE
jgi:aminopeptidase YwaD